MPRDVEPPEVEADRWSELGLEELLLNDSDSGCAYDLREWLPKSNVT